MFEMMFKFLIVYYKWLCLIEAGYVVVIGLLALLALVINLLKLLFRQDSVFRGINLFQVLLAGAVAYFYYYVYEMKDLAVRLGHYQVPIQVIALVVILILPISLAQAPGIFLAGSKPKKKK